MRIEEFICGMVQGSFYREVEIVPVLMDGKELGLCWYVMGLVRGDGAMSLGKLCWCW